MPETLHDLFVDELKDAYDAEKQLLKALRKMAKSASHPDLAECFSSHLEETNGQVGILEEVFGLLELKPRGKHCPGIAGIIEEGGDALDEMDKSPLLDAAMVGSGKRAEHYEIAAYTTLIAMANTLGYDEAAEKLDEILQQEIAADAKLDELGQVILPMANAGEDEEDDGDDSADDDESDDDSGEESEAEPDAKAPPSRGGAKKSAAKKAAPKKSAAKKTSRSR